MEWTEEVSKESERIKATTAAVLFGTNEKRATILHRNMCKMFHPDLYAIAEAKVKAEEVFKIVADKWAEWETLSGKATPVDKAAPKANVVTIAGVDYTIVGCIHESPTMKIFKVTASGVIQYLVVSRDKDKPLNTEALKRIIAATQTAGKYADYFPELLKSDFGIPQATGKHSAVLIYIEELENFRSLGYFKSLGEHILHPKDIAWIWRRILSVGAVCTDHKQPWVFNPDYEFIQVDAHVNFSLSTLCTASDSDAVVSAAQLMIDLMYEDAPVQIKRYFTSVAAGHGSKLHPAELLIDFDYVLDKVWGGRKFHEFVYPKNFK